MSRSTFASGEGRRQARGAFTLIELLVVIAIISLLLSILLPSLRQAKTMARVVICATNERNVGVGMALFASDPDGHIWPFATTSGDWTQETYAGMGSMLLADKDGEPGSYIADGKVLRCPLYPNLPFEERWVRWADSRGDHYSDLDAVDVGPRP